MKHNNFVSNLFWFVVKEKCLKLPKHIMRSFQTEKTMAELEIDLNERVGEWDVIQEAGSKLQPSYGPGRTGMINLGNSCYMNSVMQTLFTIPDFAKR